MTSYLKRLGMRTPLYNWSSKGLLKQHNWHFVHFPMSKVENERYFNYKC